MKTENQTLLAIGVGLTTMAHWGELEPFGDGGADL